MPLSIWDAVARTLRSPAFKFALIGFLILLLLIPLALVSGLVSEREGRAASVRNDIARVWGGVQQISGPALVVPYTINVETFQGDKRVVQVHERRAIFLPEDLEIAAETQSKILSRSIYDVNVYTARVALKGRFKAPDMSEVVTAPNEIRWRDALLILGLSDVSGLKEATSIKIENRDDLPFQPSIGVPGTNFNGVHVKLSGSTAHCQGLMPSSMVLASRSR